MLVDIKDIDISSEDESTIDYPIVKIWYFETEKLIRVIGNLLTTPLSQAINQLRYAGHHLLKAILAESNQVKQQNLIEAYKHCKRAYYDAIDFYVYKLSEDYRILLPYLASENASKLERSLNDYLTIVHEFRLKSKNRIEYYSDMQKTIIQGIRLIESLNEIQRDSGISKHILDGKMELIKENNMLNNHLNNLKAKVETLNEKLSSKAYAIALWSALIISLATAVGLNVSAFMTSKHSITISKMDGDFGVKLNPNMK